MKQIQKDCDVIKMQVETIVEHLESHKDDIQNIKSETEDIKSLLEETPR